MHGALPSLFTVQVNQEASKRQYGSAREYQKASIVSDECYLATAFSIEWTAKYC